jgi:ribosomal protein S10
MYLVVDNQSQIIENNLPSQSQYQSQDHKRIVDIKSNKFKAIN